MPNHRATIGRCARHGVSVALVAASATLSSLALAVDDVAGTLRILSDSASAPNGAWSWFEDERAIIDDGDPDNTLLLVGSVSSDVSGGGERGDVDLLWLNVDTGAQGEFELHDQFQSDDHNSAALMIRPDGRYLAMYATHVGGADSYWRVSTNPHDPTGWSPAQSFTHAGSVTYSNLHHLPNDNGGAGRTYNFVRVGFTPNIMLSNDQGENWSYGGILVQYGDRPYVRYFSDGQRIHLITTEGHPRSTDNSVYHGYVEDGVLYDSFAAVKDANLFDTSPISPADLTPLFTTGTTFGGTPMTHAWTTDVAIDSAGRPVALFTARANGDPSDHRFFYGTFDGSTWSVDEVAKAGAFLYAGENDYTGLGSLVPDDPDTLYVSTNVDPQTDEPLAHYEIYRGTTPDAGDTWDWEPITWNSTVDNLRPLVPKWNQSETALVWMRGTYFSWTNWETEVVALTFAEPQPVLLGDYNQNGTVDAADYTTWRDHLGQTFTLPNERTDAATPGVVDQEDYAFWKAHFGQPLTSGAAGFANSISSVPEPPSLALAAGALVGLARRARRAQSIRSHNRRSQRAQSSRVSLLELSPRPPAAIERSQLRKPL